MRILLVTGDQPWPLTSGGRHRDELLYQSSNAVGEVHLLCFPFRQSTEPGLLPEGTTVRAMPWQRSLTTRVLTRLRATLRGRLVFQQHLVQRGAVRVLAETISATKPDAVILASPLFEPFVGEVAKAGPRVFVDMTDLRSRLVSQQLRDPADLGRWIRAVLDAFAVRRVEAAINDGVEEVWFAERTDAEIFNARHRVAVRVIPNTVDVERYADLREQPADPRSFGYVGSFDYAPNVIAAERLLKGILPRLRQRVPDASLVLIGRAPPTTLSTLVDRTPGAALFGDDPEPIRRLAKAGILAAPLEVGVGTKFKIIEAASSSIPIVTSRQGLAGLGYLDQEEVIVASTDDQFADAIEQLWADRSFARRLCEAALERTRQEYDRRVSVAAVRNALLGLND